MVILFCIVTALVLSIKTLRYEYVDTADSKIFSELDPGEELDAGRDAILKLVVVSVVTAETVVRFGVAPVKSVYFMQIYSMEFYYCRSVERLLWRMHLA